MEEQNKKNDDTPKKGDIPPSKLTVVFAGPGSAQIIDFSEEGVVTTEQRAVMALFFLSTVMQDWAIPLLEQIVVKTVERVVERAVEQIVAKTVEEMMKPRIHTARGSIPPGAMGPS